MKLNEQYAKRIDSNIWILVKEVGLMDEDIIRIPPYSREVTFQVVIT